MSKFSIVGEVKDGVDIVLGTFKDVLGINATSRDFNDINKKARENELTLYTLSSDNVPSAIYSAVSEAITYQILSSIRHILNHTLINNTEDVMKYITSNFTNNSEIVNKLKSNMADMADSLGENIQVDISNIDFGLTEGPKLKAAMKTVASAAIDTLGSSGLVDRGMDTVGGAVLNHAATTQLGSKVAGYNTKRQLDAFKRDANKTMSMSKETNYDEEDKNAIKIPSKLHTIQVNYKTDTQEIKNFSLTLAISVKIMTVESSKLVSALVSSKERNIFNSYIKWRATRKNFFKDFIVNMNEIKKQVQRDTSKDLSERILGNLLSKSSFTRPKILAEVTELKNFIVIITLDEVERLKLDHNINLSRGPGLRTVFTNMNILTLVIFDEAKDRLIMYQSDKPTEMTVLTLAKLSDSSALAKIFSNIQ